LVQPGHLVATAGHFCRKTQQKAPFAPRSGVGCLGKDSRDSRSSEIGCGA
jgi:hypothetical protein